MKASFLHLLLVVVFVLVNLEKVKAQDKTIDSLKTKLALAKSDSARVLILNKLSFLLGTVEPELAYSYGKQAMQLAARSGFKTGLCHAYNNMGILYDQRGVGDSAMWYYNKSLAMSVELKNFYLQASTLSNIGYILWSQGNFDQALSYSLKALSILDTGTNYSARAGTIEHVAMIYYDLKDYTNSIKFHQQAIDVYRLAQDEASVGGVYCNLALNFLETSKDSMIFYLKKAESIFLKYNDHWALGHVYNNIGGVYVELKQPDAALVYLKKAREKRKMIGDEKGMCSTNITLGMAWLLKDKTEIAKNYIDTAIQSSMRMDMQEDLAEAYRSYALVYARLGEVDSVIHYLEKEDAIKDKHFSSEKAEAIAEMQTRYDTEKKDLEIMRNKAELAVKEKQAHIKNTIIVSIAVVLVLLVLMALVFYRSEKTKQKAKQDAEINRLKETRVKMVLEAEERERRRIAQDLHDGIGQILSAAKLNLSSLESSVQLDTSMQKEAFKNTLSLIDDSVREVRTVSHSMMPNTLIKLGLASAIREFITKIGNLPDLRVDLEIVGLDKRLDENAETSLYRAIQEIINNIIKHAKANKISIQLVRHENELSVIIEDNGKGFDTSRLNNFEGIGLKNIISRIEFINGKVHFDSTPGHGTTVVMNVPLV